MDFPVLEAVLVVPAPFIGTRNMLLPSLSLSTRSFHLVTQLTFAGHPLRVTEINETASVPTWQGNGQDNDHNVVRYDNCS